MPRPAVPRDPSFDAAIGIMREGFEYIPNRCRRFGTDLFLTRLLGQRTVCIHGAEAARIFYDESKLQRSRALPRRVVTSLFGKNAVHTLDDGAHRHRKSAYLSLMTRANLQRLVQLQARQWQLAVHRWETMDTVVLFGETARLLTRAVCHWAGVPLAEANVDARAHDLVAMIDAFGGMGPRLWRGKLARSRTQKWMMPLIEQSRRRPLEPTEALSVMAHHRDPDGALLDLRTAAVAAINIIRPTVAIAWYVAFAAARLHQQPKLYRQLAGEQPDAEHAGPLTDACMQEVRRFYPFAPFFGALVRAPFDWRGNRFEPGTLVLLDLYGTNHDPRTWGDADVFRPERFIDRPADEPFGFIPQGGGHADGHRCPGEWVTMHSLTLALHALTHCMTYDVSPDQDMGFSLARMPTRPRSGVLVRNVRATATLDAPPPRYPSRSANLLLLAEASTMPTGERLQASANA